MVSKKAEFVIEAEKRDALGTGASRRMRRSGRVPAIVYGHGKTGTTLSVSALDAVRVGDHGGMVKLAVHGRKRAITAVVKAVDQDPITRKAFHIDFQEVRMDEIIQAVTRIEPFGEPAGHQAGGQLEQLLHEVEIRCLPADLPESIRVDVSGMELDDALHIGELPLPEGVSAVAEGDIVVFQVRLPKIAVAEVETVEDEEAEEGEEGEEEGKTAEEGASEE